MSGDIINLRQYRKRKSREEKEKAAEANRIEHGRTKAEKKLTDALKRQAVRSLDQKRLESKPSSSTKGRDDPAGS